MRETSTFVWALLAIALVAILFWGLVQMGPDHTCPNYGEVPVLTEDGHKCIPWEEVQP